jgi:hypothetical protein
MVGLAETLLVTSIVACSAAYALKTLLPFRWRVEAARRLQGRLPDRMRVWLAGNTGCGACGGVIGRRRFRGERS